MYTHITLCIFFPPTRPPPAQGDGGDRDGKALQPGQVTRRRKLDPSLKAPPGFKVRY